MNTLITKLTALCLIVIAPLAASGDGLKGVNYLGASFDAYHWGGTLSDAIGVDMDDALGRSYGASAAWNYNLSPEFDVLFSYSGVWDGLDGVGPGGEDLDVSAHSGTIGLNYLFPIYKTLRPYLGGQAGFAHASAKIGNLRADETDAAFGAHTGLEWTLSKKAFLDASATYLYVDTGLGNNRGDYGISIMGGYTLIEQLVLVAGGQYIIEKDDSVLSLGLVITM